MSHSYKHYPYSGEKKGKEKKRIANKVVRNRLKNFDIDLSRTRYKKVYDTWDICDYCSSRTWKEHWRGELRFWCYRIFHGRDEPYPDEEKSYQQWYRWYLRK